MAAPGMDIPLSEGRMTGYRQFINKIWNASRFVLMNLDPAGERPALAPFAELGVAHRWVLHRLNSVTREVHEAFETFRFDVAADRLYHFFWHEYADWYIEMVKGHLQADGAERDTARGVLLAVHDRVLRLLHPIVPFVTEELWQRLPRCPEDGRTIALAPFPGWTPAWTDDQAVADVNLLQGIVTTIRTARAERTLKPSAKVQVTIEGAGAAERASLERNAPYVRALAGLSGLAFADAVARQPDLVTRVFGEMRVHIEMPHSDRAAEIAKLHRTLDAKRRESAGIDAKLANEAFLAKAAPAVVDQTRARRESLAAEIATIEGTLKELEG
jgi:valyl-tRNA synthetase